MNNEKQSRLKVYSRNVFIMENSTELTPNWLNFVYGIVDSENLPLNVSREMLQHNNTIEAIKNAFVVKSMEMLETLAGNDADMDIFYRNFAKYIKLGIYESPRYEQRLMRMLRYYTSSSGYNYRSLDEYVKSMKKEQSCIYYITGGSIETIQQSPFIERLMDNGIEVIYMTDPLDEYMIQSATEFDEYKFVSASSDISTEQGSNIFTKSLLDEAITIINKTAETPLDKQEITKEFTALCVTMKEILGSRVSKVVLSNRLSTSPACLVTSNGAWTANMERLMKLKSDGDEVNKSNEKPTKILEINPTHNIILNIKNTFAQTDKSDISNMINLIYDLSCLNSGFQLENSVQFAHSMYNMIELGLTQPVETEDEEEDEF
jgi:molecular chaperone HtpG